MNEKLEKVIGQIRKFVLKQKLSDHFKWANKVMENNKQELAPFKKASKEYKKFLKDMGNQAEQLYDAGKKGEITNVVEQIDSVQEEFNKTGGEKRKEIGLIKSNMKPLAKTRYVFKFLGAKVFLSIPVVLMSPVRWVIKKGYQYFQKKLETAIPNNEFERLHELEKDEKRNTDKSLGNNLQPSQGEKPDIREFLEIPKEQLATMYLEMKKLAEETTDQLSKLNEWVMTLQKNNTQNIRLEAGQLIPVAEHEKLQRKFKNLLSKTGELIASVLDPEQVENIRNETKQRGNDEEFVDLGIEFISNNNRNSRGRHTAPEESMTSVTPEQTVPGLALSPERAKEIIESNHKDENPETIRAVLKTLGINKEDTSQILTDLGSPPRESEQYTGEHTLGGK
ncbi:MAG: hypothetical protein WDA21_03540 [Bacilli bacterium]